ncbi:hypothetical protein [Chitinophaga sp. LS1]|uniref:hypothetical protein n=1 Tax=Chitinophaga sp. LS1 TaxID=3051176 RepID=UPI002AAB19EA|nr:hypothetical protein [Chitinophaga sp. LS1]WPV65425.1 hypothetical protein QQL36_26850 [Chitinophaga sp. LS1]
METNTTKPAQTSSHSIPMDVFMDIVRILLNNTLDWHVEGINEKENSLLIQVSYQPHLPRHRKALENIQSILADYGYYIKGSPNDDAEQYG